MSDFELKTDCRYVRWDRPCSPHKIYGKVCNTCDQYDPIRFRVLVVKLKVTRDELCAPEFLPAIHKEWPAAHVTCLTQRSVARLFDDNSLVDEVIVSEDAVSAARLATETFDVVLCADTDPDTAALASMAHAKERRGYIRDEQGRIAALSEGATSASLTRRGGVANISNAGGRQNPGPDSNRCRILMVKLAATGDVLRTTAFLPAIHEEWPGAHVTWLTLRSAAGLFDGNPLVDEVLVTDAAVTVERLVTETFDVVLCPDADPDAAVLAAMAQCKDRRGYVRDEYGNVLALGDDAAHWLQMGLSDVVKKANTQTYQSLVSRVLGFSPDSVREPVLEPAATEAANAQEFVRGLGIVDGKSLVGLNTGAGGRWLYKQWTKEHQETFLRLCDDAGLSVLLLGGSEEVQRHQDLMSFAKGMNVFDGGNDNSYGRFAALIDQCGVVVTSDSLAVHVTTARKKPAVVLFGPTSSAEIDLYGRGTKITPEGLDCLCCYLPRCDKVPHCQALIEPEAVLRAVQQWLV